MLSAQKRALQATLTQDVVALQNQELSFYYNNFASINTMSAVIGGFAFSGLVIGTTYTGFFTTAKTTRYIVIQCFYLSASCSIGFCMITCIMCTALNVRGPGLALRGPEGSLKRSVDLMRTYQRHVNSSLTLGIVFFHLTAMTYSWIMLSRLVTTVLVTVVLSCFLAVMVTYVRSILRDYRIPADNIVAGGMDVTDLLDVAAKTGVSYQQKDEISPSFDADEKRLGEDEDLQAKGTAEIEPMLGPARASSFLTFWPTMY